jgi:uncharacterized protein YdeI (YjbR/CyaY-like superfamily)
VADVQRAAAVHQQRDAGDEVPSWFKAALEKNPRAKRNWEVLIPSRKKEILRSFMARAWNQGA